MDALDIVRYQTKRRYAWLDNLVADVSQDGANWRPPGTANSIAATYGHAVISADVDLNRHFHGREPVIAGEWSAKLGLGESFPDDFRAEGEIDWALLRAYGGDVRVCIEGLVDSLTIGDLERSFEMPAPLGKWKGVDAYLLHGAEHISMHGGEIACLKGLQGGQGYRPFHSLYLDP